MKRAVKINIKGLVQGVFFRNFIKEKAEALGLKGHVRNMSNGSVEVLVQGSKDKIDRMVNICKRGPPHARIDEVEIEPVNLVDGLKEFKVLRF